MTATLRQNRGAVAYQAGRAAEKTVARTYQKRGCILAHDRWRGKGGEIDLIVRSGAQVIFVEVKKSRTFDQAASRLSRRQMDRLCAAASEFVEGEPTGQLTEMRFDLALVNALGDVHILENAFGEV